MKKVIYSAIFNNYDRVKTPVFKNDDFDYIMFLDSETFEAQKPFLKDVHWEIVIVNDFSDGNLKAKDIKINPEKYLGKYDFSIYVDGSFCQINDLNLLARGSRYSYVMCGHPRRNCLYEEAIICTKQRLDCSVLIGEQIQRYKLEGYPADNGLLMGGIIARKHNRKSKRINRAWWKEIENGSVRDQLSINYVLWKLGEKIGISDYENDIKNIFKLHKHLGL